MFEGLFKSAARIGTSSGMRHWQRNALATSSIVLREDRRLSRLRSSVESFFGLLV